MIYSVIMQALGNVFRGYQALRCDKGVWFGKIWSAPNFKKSTPNKNLERSKFSHAIGYQINGIGDTTNNGPFWSTIDVYR